MFTHCYVAEEVLNKIKKKNIISDFNNIDDYYFGAIAPDIRYMNNSDRDITHIPFEQKSVLNGQKFARYSNSFIAGYETHLIVDGVWSGSDSSSGESIYNIFGVDVNNFVQKFTLYFLIDDYFQNKSNWFFQLGAVSNIIRSDKNNLLYDLGFNLFDVGKYKSLALFYFREPGLDTFNIFNFAPTKLDENLISNILSQKPKLNSFLRKFVKESVEKCKESFEAGL